MRQLFRSVTLAAALGLAAHAAHAQQPPDPSDMADDEAGMPAAASSCLSCHGAEGRPVLADVPIIAGQQPLYLRNALQAYKRGWRSGGQALVMQEIVKPLDDDEIEALARWFGGQ